MPSSKWLSAWSSKAISRQSLDRASVSQMLYIFWWETMTGAKDMLVPIFILMIMNLNSMHLYTLFSKRSAHENHPNFLKSLGYRPQPRVILILSNSLESNFCIYLQDHLTNLTWPWVRVSDPGSSGEMDEINVHFFWRRVYNRQHVNLMNPNVSSTKHWFSKSINWKVKPENVSLRFILWFDLDNCSEEISCQVIQDTYVIKLPQQ